MVDHTGLTERLFGEHGGLLRGVAYRVLGSVTEAEDVVQEAWLRWSRVDPTTVDDAEGYLVRTTVRLAIDQLRSARVRRESYVGSWLPEPMLTSPDIAEDAIRAESVSSAMLLVLETLSTMERVVFVLREVFGYSYAEIAEYVDRRDTAVRQIAHRARTAVRARNRRYDTDQATRRLATERFMAACFDGDVQELLAVLAPDVTLIGDGGGFNNAPRKPIHGVDVVARASVVLSTQRPSGSVARILHINGGPGIAVFDGDKPVLTVSLHLVDGAIHAIHVVSNPEKLTGIAV